MFRIFEPNKIFQITSKAPKYILFLFVVVLTVGLTEALILSPEDYKQSDAVRIMYVHVPSAWISLGIFSSITLLSISGFIFKNKNFFLMAKSLAPSGFVFNIIALVTGAIWGKPTWGTYWVWDARLTTTLLLFLIFMGYFLLRMSTEDRDKESRLAAVIGIIGFLDIPIIHKSVEWWRTLHQPTTLFKTEDGIAKPSIPDELLYPLLATMMAMLLFYLFLLQLRYRMETSQDELKQLMAQDRMD